MKPFVPVFLTAMSAASLSAQRPANANGASPRFTLRGIVVTDDGVAVLDGVAVFLTCGGVRVAITYANQNSRFAFPQMSSASSDCQVSPNQPGYTSAIVNASSSVASRSPDGKVVIHKVAQMEGVLTSATSAGASKDAKTSFDIRAWLLRRRASRRMPRRSSKQR